MHPKGKFRKLLEKGHRKAAKFSTQGAWK